MSKKWLWPAAAILVGVSLFVLSSRFASLRENEDGVAVALARAQISTQFLDDEAGISAYFKAPSTIDLASAKSAYLQPLEEQTQEYILGWVIPRDGVPDDFKVRVYTGRDGWVVAHYLWDDPTSKIIDWETYLDGTFTTYLEEALQKVGAFIGLGVPSKNVGYYHYAYPAANRLIAIVGVDDEGLDAVSFTFSVPDGLAISETSWSLFVGEGVCSDLLFRDTKIAAFGSGGNFYCRATGTQFGRVVVPVIRDVPIEVTVSTYFTPGNPLPRDGAHGAIVVLYTDP